MSCAPIREHIGTFPFSLRDEELRSGRMLYARLEDRLPGAETSNSVFQISVEDNDWDLVKLENVPFSSYSAEQCINQEL